MGKVIWAPSAKADLKGIVEYISKDSKYYAQTLRRMLKVKNLVRMNVMIDKELIKSIDKFAAAMSEDRSTAIRQLIKKAIAEEKIVVGIKKFQEGVSFRRAAEIAGMDYWDF